MTKRKVDKAVEIIHLSMRRFKRELHDRMHLLKARRRISLGVEENLEDLYNLVVEAGLKVMEGKLPPAAKRAEHVNGVEEHQTKDHEVEPNREVHEVHQ